MLNFKGGEREMRESLEHWNQEQVVEQNAEKDRPPTALHFESEERLMQSANATLKQILHRASISEDVLTTSMTEVEELLNARR